VPDTFARARRPAAEARAGPHLDQRWGPRELLGWRAVIDEPRRHGWEALVDVAGRNWKRDQR
jgi:hypothetical protein